MASESEADQDLPRFVLVPVPAEHVFEVMRWVLFRAPSDDPDMVEGDAIRLTEFVVGADETARSVLLFLAREAVLGAEPLRLEDLAADLGLDSSTVNGILRQTNKMVGRDIVELRWDPTVGARGKVGKASFVSMRLDYARVVRRALPQMATDGPNDADDEQADARS